MSINPALGISLNVDADRKTIRDLIGKGRFVTTTLYTPSEPTMFRCLIQSDELGDVFRKNRSIHHASGYLVLVDGNPVESLDSKVRIRGNSGVEIVRVVKLSQPKLL